MTKIFWMLFASHLIGIAPGANRKEVADLRQRFDSLTSREQEVVSMVVAGMLNKQIAAELGTAESTVKVQRSRAMEKMQAASLADLIKMIEKLKSLGKSL